MTLLATSHYTLHEPFAVFNLPTTRRSLELRRAQAVPADPTTDIAETDLPNLREHLQLFGGPGFLEGLRHHPASGYNLGIGHLERFVWRLPVLEAAKARWQIKTPPLLQYAVCLLNSAG